MQGRRPRHEGNAVTELAVYQAAGSGCLTVSRTIGGGYAFRTTGDNLTISEDEATELAEAILACTRATP